MTAVRTLFLAFVAAFVGCTKSTPQQSQPKSTNRDTVAQVCAITAELLGVKKSDIKPSTSLADLRADALDTVELVMELEELFDVSIPDVAITNVTGNDNWQTGMDKLTMSKLAEIVDQQKR